MAINARCAAYKPHENGKGCPNCNRLNREERIGRKLVDDILAAGYTVSVFDSEEWTLKRSSSRKDILAAMFTTDDDRLAVRTPEGDRIGTFWLVWGNDTDVLTDWSWAEGHEDTMEALAKGASDLADSLA